MRRASFRVSTLARGLIDGSVDCRRGLVITVIVAMLNVMFHSFLGMMSGMHAVAVRQEGMMSSLFMMASLVVLCGFAMMLGGTLVVLCGALVVLGGRLVMFFVLFSTHRSLLRSVT